MFKLNKKILKIVLLDCNEWKFWKNKQEPIIEPKLILHAKKLLASSHQKAVSASAESTRKVSNREIRTVIENESKLFFILPTALGVLIQAKIIHNISRLCIFQLRSIFPSGRFTVWSLWGKELFSWWERVYSTCSFSWEAFFPLEGLQCEVYEGRNSIFPWWGEYSCSFSWEAFFARKGLQCGVYEWRNSVPRWESVLYMFFQLRSIFSIRRWESVQYTCSFSKEALFALEGLQCGVYTVKKC